MSDFAAVSGHVAAKSGAAAISKGAGVKAGAGTVLDGAFAALFGKAADEAEGEGKLAILAAQGGKASQVPPVFVEGPADPEALQTSDGEIDPATGKPRKGGSRKDGKADDQLLEAQAAVSGSATVAPQANPATRAKNDSDAAKAVGDASGAPAEIPTNDLAVVAQALADKPAKSDAKPVKAVQTGATPVAAKDQPQPANVPTNDAAGSRGDKPTDGRADDGQSRDRGAPATTMAASDDSALAGAADPLRDIMQSLPPVLQSQLNVGGAQGASAARTASTGELLGNRAIDMSVSGQWIDRMAREIAGLAEGTGHARFQLSPPNLGRIQVDLWQGDDKMNLRLLAETDEAARRLREGQGALEAHARVASLSLGSVSVEKSSAPFESRDQNQRQSDPGANSQQQQQASAQTQGQSAQGRGNSGGSANHGGFSAVMEGDSLAESEQAVRTPRADDPRVRFA